VLESGDFLVHTERTKCDRERSVIGRAAGVILGMYRSRVALELRTAGPRNLGGNRPKLPRLRGMRIRWDR
jgi:hypothetical protein